MDTLFGHLALKFGSHPENLATEGLHFVLDRSKEARRLFLRFLAQAGCPLGDDLAFETQVSGKDGGIPDLVGRDTSGAEAVIVEAKFWAGLTDHQPNTYIDRLKGSPGLLLFVAPARRFESLWPELLTRCRSAGRQVECEEGHGPDWRVGRLAGGRWLALTSWRAVLEALHAGLQQASEVSLASDILQLRGLADRMDADAFLPLASEELTSNLGRRIVQFCDLVNYAVQKLVAEKLADTKGYSASSGKPGRWGRYFRMHEACCLLYFSPEGWAKHGEPIWLAAYDSDEKPSAAVNEALRPLATESPPRLFISQWGAYVPVRLPTGVERDKVLDAMLTQLRRVADLLREVKPAGKAAPPSHQEPELVPDSHLAPPGGDALAANGVNDDA
jgi:hypothetical protein